VPSRRASAAPKLPTGRTVREGGHVVEMQRRRLLSATVSLVYERGVQALTVATVCERAGMSRRTFYEIFDEREACLHAAFEDAVERAREIVTGAVVGERRWRDRIRAGLGALLVFLDREPAMARLLIVDALGAGGDTLESRRRVLAEMIAVVEEGRAEVKAGLQPPSLTAEGVVGAVSSVIHARMLERDPRPLAELAGALMAMIVQPYLGAAGAQRELERPATAAQSTVPRFPADPFKDLPIRLTYRTVRVLSSIAGTPGISNKQVARTAGIADEGQTSKLLTRLQRYGLIHDTGVGPTQGMPRAWSLTERGEGVLEAIGQG
jgi:AcrR family transcriptional regulator